MTLDREGTRMGGGEGSGPDVKGDIRALGILGWAAIVLGGVTWFIVPQAAGPSSGVEVIGWIIAGGLLVAAGILTLAIRYAARIIRR